MDKCLHKNIILIHENSVRLRCRHCHLTIKAEDLTDGYCPECFEAEGKKRNNFEEVQITDSGEVRYRCEDCKTWLDPKI